MSEIFKRYENSVAKNLDGVIAVTENMCERFSEFTRCVVIPNYPDPEDFRGISRKERSDGEIRFVYTGSIDIDRSIEEMLLAFEKVSKKYPNVKFTIVGRVFLDKLENEVKRFENENPDFKFIDFVPRRRMLEIVSEHDIGLVIYKRHGNSIQSSPNKIFDFMFLGLPMIASDFPYWRRILDKGPCALYVDPDDPDDIAKKMEIFIENEDLRREYSKNALRISREFTWNILEKGLIEFYKEVAK